MPVQPEASAGEDPRLVELDDLVDHQRLRGEDHLGNQGIEREGNAGNRRHLSASQPRGASAAPRVRRGRLAIAAPGSGGR